MVAPKLFGADTNFLMDLADQKEAAWTAWEIGKRWGHSFLILPVVAGELFYLSENGQAKEKALASCIGTRHCGLEVYPARLERYRDRNRASRGREPSS